MSLVDPGRPDAPTAVARTTSRTTIVVSLVAHAAVIVVAVVVPLFAQVQLPSPAHPIEAVRQWRYDPPRLNGTPVSVLLTVTVQFAQ